MTMPLRISYHGMGASPAVAAAIEERGAKLSQLYDRIMSCRVVVESPHRSHRKGNLFQVKVDITVPGEELVVNRDSGQDHAHEDVYVVIRDAFDAMERRLKTYVSKHSEGSRPHATPKGY